MARPSRNALVAWLSLWLFSLSYGQSPTPPVPQDIPEKFRLAEEAAGMQYKLDLAKLRQEGELKKWKFKMGYTSAFALPVDSIATTQIPENYLAMASAQNAFAAKANGAVDESARLAGAPQPPFLGRCTPGLVRSTGVMSRWSTRLLTKSSVVTAGPLRQPLPTTPPIGSVTAQASKRLSNMFSIALWAITGKGRAHVTADGTTLLFNGWSLGVSPV